MINRWHIFLIIGYLAMLLSIELRLGDFSDFSNQTLITFNTYILGALFYNMINILLLIDFETLLVKSIKQNIIDNILEGTKKFE